MLDRWSLKLIANPLARGAKIIANTQISANQITWAGFIIGMSVLPTLASQYFSLALILIIINRLFDGLDGALARHTKPTNQGAYLDIVLDFIFYSAVIFGFALADPQTNALPAAALIFGFMGTGSSFLAFAILAERLSLTAINYPSKGFYYLGGLTEGTETLLFFIAMCVWPQHFALLAWIFFALCIVTTFTRVFGGAKTLSKS